MHTRYAPVRHSRHPERCLPYDLHVLGLPLAFILSQDQTLRCNIVFQFCFSLNLGFRLPAHRCADVFLTRFLLLASTPDACAGLRLSKNFTLPYPFFHAPRPFRKRVQKYYLFFIWQALFSNIFHFLYISLNYNEKKFHISQKPGDFYTYLY